MHPRLRLTMCYRYIKEVCKWSALPLSFESSLRCDGLHPRPHAVRSSISSVYILCSIIKAICELYTPSVIGSILGSPAQFYAFNSYKGCWPSTEKPGHAQCVLRSRASLLASTCVGFVL